MARFGLTVWSSNSEIFVTGVVGMCVAAAETPLSTIRPDMKEVWNLELPPELFSGWLQYLLRLILINVIIVRCVTVHCYCISFLFTTWPIFLEEQPWMLLPWLVIGAVKNIVLELVVLLTGCFMFMRYGSPFNVYCMEFLLIKGVMLTLSVYLWMSTLFLYCDLANPPRMFSRDETSTNKRLEVAIRRRMCKSLCTEVVWRRRMLEDLETGSLIHVTVSLDEDLVMNRKMVRTKPTRSLDSILDRMGYDWDMLDDLSTRRELEGEGEGGKIPLSIRARKFLQLNKNDIIEARKRRFNYKERDDKATQTNTLSKRFLDAYSRKSLESSSLSYDSTASSKTNPELHVKTPIPRMIRKFSPLTLQPEMAERGAKKAEPEMPVHSLLKNLNITMPPRFGYKHATTQVNNISRKYLADEDGRVRQNSDVTSVYDHCDGSFVQSPPGSRVVVVSLCTDFDDNSTDTLTSSAADASPRSAGTGRNNPTSGLSSPGVAPAGAREATSAQEATSAPTRDKGKTSARNPLVYVIAVSESKSPFVTGKDSVSKSESESEDAVSVLQNVTSLNELPISSSDSLSMVQKAWNTITKAIVGGDSQEEKGAGTTVQTLPDSSPSKRRVIIRSDPDLFIMATNLDVSSSIGASNYGSQYDSPETDEHVQGQPAGRRVVVDHAVPGTSREVQANEVQSVYSMSLGESDFSLGLAREIESTKKVPRPPTPKQETSARKWAMIDIRPSMRTIKRMAVPGNTTTLIATLSKPPVTTEVQPEAKKPTLVKGSKKQEDKSTQKVRLAIDITDSTDDDDDVVVGVTATRRPASRVGGEEVQRALALNDRKLIEAARRHKTKRPASVLQLLVTDADFDPAIPQTAQVPIRRDSSGSLHEFLANEKGAPSKKD